MTDGFGELRMVNATEIGRNADIAMDAGHSASAQAGRNGSCPAGSYGHPGAHRPGNGVQRKRCRGGQSIPRPRLFSQASTHMAYGWPCAYASGVPYRLYLVETLGDTYSRPAGHLARTSAGALVWCRGEWSQTLASCRADFNPTGRTGETGRRNLSGSLLGQEGRPDHELPRRAGTALGCYRSARRVCAVGTRLGNCGGDGFGRHQPLISGGGADLSSGVPGTLCRAGPISACSRIQVSARASDDVLVSVGECLGCGISDHAIVPCVWQRWPVGSGVGGGQTKAFLFAGGPYRFCIGVGGRRIGSSRDRSHHSALRLVRRARVSGCRAGTDAVRAVPRYGDHPPYWRTSADQRVRGDGARAEQRTDLAIRQLRWVFVGHLYGGSRNLA